jgi:CBS domain-containing protein
MGRRIAWLYLQSKNFSCPVKWDRKSFGYMATRLPIVAACLMQGDLPDIKPERRMAMNNDVRDIMTPGPHTIQSIESVMNAAQLMRKSDIGDVIVVEDEQLFGILTDRDIVVRVLAEGRDPETTPVGDICSRELTTVRPTDSVGDVVRVMREKAIRRLPVVEESGEVIGIVSIGDVAVERDRHSALADISAAPPNV